MAVVAAVIISSAVTTVTAGRIKLALDPVQSHVIAPMRHLSVRPVTVLCGRLDFSPVCMTVAAERTFVTQST